MPLFLDTETYSATPLKDGFMNYVSDDEAEVMLLSYALDDGEVKLWDRTRKEPMPDDLRRWIYDRSIKIVAHKSDFDRRMLVYTRLFPDAYLGVDRWEDTMVQALAHGLPGALDALCMIFGIEGDDAKDKRGKQLIHLFCKPNPKGERNTEATHPEQWAVFREYATKDVRAMRVLYHKLPRWNYPNGAGYQTWLIDQKINQRGFQVDVELCETAVATAAGEKAELKSKVQEATDNEVSSATKNEELLRYVLKAHGIELPDLRADTLKRRIEDESLPRELRELLALRVASSRNAASKYKAALRCVNRDGRLRDTLQFSGAAGTGRWSGRVFQPQNLMRPTMSKADIEDAIRMIKIDMASVIYPNLSEVLGNCVRGVLIAPPGKKLVVNDYSSIEGRGLAYLAREHFIVDFYRQVDNGEVDYDSYMLAYAMCFGITPSTVTKLQRQLGKPIELAFGYGGGVASFLTFAMTYHLDLAKVSEAVWETGDPLRLKECLDKYEWAKANGYDAGLPPQWYAAFEYVKQVWREKRPATVLFWNQLNDAFTAATEFNGQTFTAGEFIKVRRDGHWLRVRLPSGRCLVFLQPAMRGRQCTYMGMDHYSHRWRRLPIHGGKLAGLVTQAVANDILRQALPRLENEGYEVVMTVHDEAIAEVPDTPEMNNEHMASIMTAPISWLPNFPLASDGFDTYRYRKE